MSVDVPAPKDLELIDNFAYKVFNIAGLIGQNGRGKRILSIGSRPNSNDYIVSWFIQQGYDTTILEIFEPYVKQLREKGLNVIHGDVRDAEKIFKGNSKFDVIIWWHGPEHIEKHIALTVTKTLKSLTDCLIYATPYGIMESGAVDGNISNSHLSAFYPEDFIGMGMKEFHWSYEGVPNAVIVAFWKR